MKRRSGANIPEPTRSIGRLTRARAEEHSCNKYEQDTEHPGPAAGAREAVVRDAVNACSNASVAVAAEAEFDIIHSSDD